MTIFYNISPKKTKYEELVGVRQIFEPLRGEHNCDIAIIGGGFTGLSAAYNLAKADINTILIDAGKFGDAASGRNGGQIGVGHRRWVSDLEKIYGYDTTKNLLSLWYEAKTYFHQLLDKDDYNKGHISAIHKPSLINSYRENINDMERYGYNSLRFLQKKELYEKLGSRRYKAGVYDSDTGHVNPLKAVLKLVKLAQDAGAHLFENTSAINIEKNANLFYIKTTTGTIKASKILIATNGYNIADISGLGGVFDQLKKYIFPIYSYIAATIALKDEFRVLPDNESVDDSRFAVRYFRKEKDGSLIFGGAETYYGAPLSRIRAKVYKQIIEVYPQLKRIKLTHGWGGVVAITRQRMPYVKELYPGVTYCGGYSGHGLCLAPFLGKLYADTILFNEQTKNKFTQFKDLKSEQFLGGRYMTIPALFLALSWYAFLDKF